MKFLVSANSDIGITKDTNQDSLTVKLIKNEAGQMVFALLCDGMGGLAKGEVASASVIKAFEVWVNNTLARQNASDINAEWLKSEWFSIVNTCNTKIRDYGAKTGVRLGTTVVAILLTQTDYYVLNVGDSRAYEFTSEFTQLTNDQTFVAREVAQGRMTEEQAKTDSRRSVLLQCVGASLEVYPDLFTGKTKPNASYMLCSDGFRHEITPQEIYAEFNPASLTDFDTMNRNTLKLIELNKSRRERDNISVVLIRTY